MTALEQARALLLQLTAAAGAAKALVDALTPAAPPPPAPAPPPPPPPADAAPALTTQRLNPAAVVCVRSWHASGQYERHQVLERWSGDSARVQIHRVDFNAGGRIVTLAGTEYTLLVDGTPVATARPDGLSATFVVPLASVTPGWHRLDIHGLVNGETAPTWFALRVLPGMAPPMSMPVCTNSYDVTHEANWTHAWAMVPARYTPTPRPLADRPYSNVADGDALFGELLVPGESAQINRPAQTKEGVLCTFSTQAYHWEHLIGRSPVVHLLDGPRGVGAISMVTHISVGQGRREDKPDSPLMGNLYACTPWSVVRVDKTGRIDTLVGYRHAPVPGYWLDAPKHELVGDWSSVPEAERGFRELWGLAWAPESLRVDATAQPIASEAGRVPHSVRPTMVVADSQRNRLVQVTFDPRAHGVPPKVTVLATGADLWDVVEWRGSWIASERGADRVIQLGRDGSLQRVIVSIDPSMPARAATLASTHTPYLQAGTLDQARQQPILRPEGLYVLDDWLYVGSVVQQQVIRIHLVTGQHELVCRPRVDGNARYLKLAVSDGSFLAAGTVFVQQWSNNWVAQAVAYRPDGTQIMLPQSSEWLHRGYGAAVAVGHGRLYVASSAEGIVRISKRLPSDRPLNGARYRRGKAEYDKACHRLLHGPLGFGHYGWPHPAGSDDLRSFLEAHG